MGTGRNPHSLVDLLRARCTSNPDLPVQTFLADGQSAEQILTCARLDRRARAIGAALRHANLHGRTILLLYPPGLDFIEAFFGCLYAGAIAVPAYPPKANRSFGRLQAILQDAGAAAVLCTAALLPEIRQRLASTEDSATIRLWLATDQLADTTDGWQQPEIGPDDVAFLQYTSGSTGDPKGVMVSHGNILHNSECLKQAFSLNADSVGVCWLPSFHDMGLITGVIAPIYSGFRHYIMAPAAFLQKPIRWLEAISRLRATFSGGPNSAYELCLRSILPEQCRDLDLSSWAVAFNGAEPVRAETLRRFAETFRPYGFDVRSWLPGYGMAEATLMISCGPTGSGAKLLRAQSQALQQHNVICAAADEPDAIDLVGSGQMAPDTQVLAVDPDSGVRCEPGRIGELWVRGPGVARGYWNRPELTESTFHARVGQDGPYLRTGDLGYVESGQVYVTGRLKDLVIIRGRNFYPQDIELTVERAHPVLSAGTAAAFSIEAGRQEQLVVAVEVQRQHRRNVKTDEVFAAIRRAIAEEHDLQVHGIVLLQPSSVPKTSSGKIQRHPCRDAYLKGELDTIADWTAPLDEPDMGAGVVSAVSPAELESWLCAYVARRTGIAAGRVDVQQPFAAFGLGSLEAVELAGQLERHLGRPVPSTLVYDQPSIAAVVRFLTGPSRTSAQRSGDSNDPIAIIGIGCRLPGSRGPEEFWKVLATGKDCVRQVPPGRFGPEAVDDPRLAWGGFLDDVDLFDADFFGLAPREVAHMDPQQRLLLEVAWETLENAGCDPRDLAGTAAGVFVGISGSDYLRLLNGRDLDAYVGTGNAGSIAANRLSYFLDLRGPSIAIDTACSSSLVAVHLACNSLRSGECRTALAGGVNLVLSPDISRIFAQAGMLAADGRCKTFAAGADGYVRGEGCGMVLLKRLSDAQADGDRVLAVIRSSAVNQDGRSNGLTAPNGPAQEAVIRSALTSAGLSPLDIDYVEAHGTGTELGDPIEVQALGAALCAARPADRRLQIGSVKTNIGHLEAAAGIAGLIKVVLSLQHGQIPAHLHMAVPNPLIPWKTLAIEAVREGAAWPASDRPRRAGVSSFGFGGTNAHVILEEAPRVAGIACEVERPAHLLVLSARDEGALAQCADRLRETLASGTDVALADVCFTASTGRSHFEQRCAVVATSRAEAIDALAGVSSASSMQNVFRGSRRAAAPKVAFLFTGQGAQYMGMGRQLFDTQPTFRQALLQCDNVFRECCGRSLVDLLYGHTAGASELLDRTLYAQPAMFALEWSLARMWMAWGVVPAAVMGHSLGEYVAACVAGVFTLEEGLQLVARRAELMDQAPGSGRMIAVFAAPGQVVPLLQADRVSLASIQADREIVVSGDAGAIEELTRLLDGKGLAWQALRVSHGFHSPLMEPILPAFGEMVRQVRHGTPAIPIVSNLLGEVVRDGRLGQGDYWVRHLRQPVRFAEGIRALAEQEAIGTFIEIGPHPVLVSAGQRAVNAPEALWLASLRRGADDWKTLLGSVAQLYVNGGAIDWRGFEGDYPRRKVSLPTYPFQRTRHWFESRDAQGSDAAGAAPLKDADQWLYDVHWQPKRQQPGIVSADFSERPSELVRAVRSTVPELVASEIPPGEERLLEGVEEICVDYVAAAMAELGLVLAKGERIDAAEAVSRLNILPRHRRLFERLLAILGEAGLLKRDGGGWVVKRAAARRTPAEGIASLKAEYGRDSALLDVVCQCGGQLASVLRGQVDPLGLLFPQGGGVSAERLYRDAPGAKVLNAMTADLIGRAVAKAPPGRMVRVLEIGAGTGGTTAAVLPALPADRVSYTFTDVSAYFLAAARKAFGDDPRIRYATLDIDRDPGQQGFEPHAYDIILAANVLHATPNLRRCLTNVRNLLAPAGTLVLLEGMTVRRCLDLTFGLLDGWWSFQDTDLRSHPLLSAARWTELLGECRYTDTALVPDGNVAGLSGQGLIVARGPVAGIATPRPSIAEGTWVICTDRGEIGEALAARLSSRGADCIQISDPKKLDGMPSARGVVFLADAAPVGDANDTIGRQTALLTRALRLSQAAIRHPSAPALWFVTRGAQWVAGEAGPADPAQAGLWGLGQVIGLEHPATWAGMVDLDPQGGAEQAEVLAEVLLTRGAETSVVLRGGVALVPRLVRASLPASLQTTTFRPDAMYLVTGGLGAVGLSIARWMVERGARHLALLGRRGLAAGAEPQAGSVLNKGPAKAGTTNGGRGRSLQQLEALGARVTVLAADVADRDSLANALDTIRGQGLPLRGVIHAAGVPGARAALEMDEAELAAVLRPKAAGAWHLHELTAGDPIELFVCFSSASSILGADGQAHYAAANRCMDALTGWRRRHDLPALSVNWGRWGTAGMLTADAHAHFAQVGLLPMEPGAAAEMLGRLLAAQRSQALVAAIDWNVFKPLYEARRARPLLECIEVQDERTEAKDAEQGALERLLRSAPAARRREMLIEHIEREVARTLGRGASAKMDRSAGFFEMGMDSLMAVSLRGRLQAHLGRPLPKTLAFEHPNVDSLADFLLGECFAEQADGPGIAGAHPGFGSAEATATKTRLKPVLRTLGSPQIGECAPIAIIGAGCRFPGQADDLDAFWRVLVGGVDAIREVPADRWDIDRWYDPDPDAPGRMYTRYGGFIEGVDRFDPQFFGIAPREAVGMDPQHRLLLEVAWEALENAGCAPTGLKGSRAGVFVGATSSDYTEILAASGAPDAYYITGNSLNAAAGRVSYLLGLRGPSMVIDAACASSLVAVHLACRSLRTGECDLAMAGGVNLILSPRGTVAACRAKMLSPSGRCRTFDAGADGFIRGEGCGMIVLKRLSEAQAAGDRILAVIRGSALGQDGASGGLTVPNAAAQQDVIRRALDDAGVSGSQIDYVEAHGTGTSLGDPIEVRALGAVFGGQRDPGRPLLLGSAKTNIGHTESASGIAGLIKVVLSLQHRQIPPHLHLREINTAIDLAAIPAAIPTTTTAWESADRPRMAGVSSFGASGTLAHVVVEEAPRVGADAGGPDRPAHVFTLSARSEAALADLARRTCDALAGDNHPLADICLTAAVGRSHFEHRWAIVCADREDLARKLDALLSGGRPAGTHAGIAERSSAPKVAWAMEAQGRLDLCSVRELCETSPAFRAAVDRCDRVLREKGLAVADTLSTATGEQAVVPAVRLALQWSLGQLWRSWGIEPAAIRQGAGAAIAAECLAGNVTIEEGLRAITAGAVSASNPRRGDGVEILAGERLVWPDGQLVISLAAATWSDLLDRLGRLYVRGVAVNWSGFDNEYPRRKVQLPTYPFQRLRCWPDGDTRLRPQGPAVAATDESLSLAGRKMSLPVADGIHYEAQVGAERPAYLADHRVAGRVVLPATAYLEMALSAGSEQLGLPLVLEGVSFERPLFLPAGGSSSMHTVLTPQPGGGLAFTIFSRQDGDSDLWVKHASGQIARGEASGSAESLESVQSRCSEPLRVEPFYRELAARGLQFGKAFQGIVSLWRGPDAALGQIRLPAEAAGGSAGCRLHPALLDACSQVVAAALAPPTRAGELYVLVGVEQLICQEPAGSEVWCHATPTLPQAADTDRYRANLAIYDARGRLIAAAVGLTYQRVGAGTFGALGGNGQAGTNGHAPGQLVSSLQAAPVGERLARLEAHVRQQVAAVLGLPQWPDPRGGFFDLGMDSLSAVELVNTLHRDLGKPVPATVIFERGNAHALAEYLLQEICGPAEVIATPTEPEAGLDALSTEEMAALFARTLDEIKGPKA